MFPSRNPHVPYALTALAVVAAILYAVVPYSTGYGNLPVPNAQMLWRIWQSSPDWQHGMLVVPISIWLAWRKWPEVLATRTAGDARGLIILGVAMLIFLFGQRANVQYFGYISFQLLLAGLAITLMGWASFLKLLFPWAFLTFAWPFVFLDSMISAPLRMIMATASAHVLNFIGIATEQRGTALLSAADPNLFLRSGQIFSLDVADPCSGLHSLFALTMLTAIYGHLTQKENWKRWVLFLCSAPLAILGNMVRVMSIALIAALFSQEFAVGTFHTVSGYLVFVVAISAMTLIGKMLSSIGTKSTPELPTAVPVQS